MRKLKVYEASGCSMKDVPCISLQGRWLEELGFKKGSSFIINENEGRLVIELVKENPEVYVESKIKVKK